ncbi:methionine/alanine import family NSS transporter small subunit [Nocardioides sp. JQ2195]|nr:methionine/alanine import family NSS transporter small subunit [Nocardioides sp. JQ2195]QIX25186.1 methionine/alanine import family NSS transporter small subunit [Nocardioides sp. JQ2195]
MSSTAIIMMLVAMLVIWGGLGLAVMNLMRSTPPTPDEIRRDL